MADLRLWLISIILYNFLIVGIYSRNTPKCPSQCICDKNLNVRRVSCTDFKIVNVELDIPKNVQAYDLTGNLIKELEDFVFRNMALDSLIELNLSKNSISWIALHAFVGLHKLRFLNLSYNRLEEAFQPDHFSDNVLLESLDVSGNKFLNLKNKPFLEHNNLRSLDLSSCRIEHLPEKVFTGLPNLKILDLSKNSMTMLEVTSISQLKLTHIFLDGNHWHCDEKSNNLQQWLSTKKVTFQKICLQENKMFEKLQVNDDHLPDDRKSGSVEDLDESWYSEEEQNIETVETPETLFKNMSFIDRFNDIIPSTSSLIIGFHVGLLVGVFIAYCWLSEMCKHKSSRTRRRRHARRIHYSRSGTNRNGLLLSNDIIAGVETPPVVRRQHSQVEDSCRSTSWEPVLPEDAERIVAQSSLVVESQVSELPCLSLDRSETPPPAYQDCLHDSFITS